MSFESLIRMSLRGGGGGSKGVGNLVIPIIPLYSLSFPKVPQGSLVPSPLEPPPLIIHNFSRTANAPLQH